MPNASLMVIATPLGNLGDLSPRATQELTSADLWLVEDTRVGAKLQAILNCKIPMKRVDEHTSDGAIAKIIDEISASSLRVCLLSDAGTPAISDPGAKVVDLAYEVGVHVDACPGPSAVTDALSLSGFFAQRFAFLGFVGRKRGDIAKELAPFTQSTMTLALFESPFRVSQILEVAAEVLGDRRYALCRELTKTHQQIYRGQLPYVPNEEEVPRKGEFTIVFEGFRKKRS